MTGKTATSRSKPVVKGASAPAGASHILSPVRGPRAISHRQIKDAVDKVFRERDRTRA